MYKQRCLRQVVDWCRSKVLHTAIFLACIKRLLVLKTHFWSSFEFLLKTDFLYAMFLSVTQLWLRQLAIH